MKRVILTGAMGSIVLGLPALAQSSAELRPFQFKELTTDRPISSDWSSPSCFDISTSNATYCPAVMMDVTERRVMARVTLTDRKLSRLSIASRFLNDDVVRASFTVRYGPACRPNVWCFSTGELKLYPSDIGAGLSETLISYEDRINLEVKKESEPKVDF